MEWWNDGMMEWWNDGMMEWWNDGIRGKGGVLGLNQKNLEKSVFWHFYCKISKKIYKKLLEVKQPFIPSSPHNKKWLLKKREKIYFFYKKGMIPKEMIHVYRLTNPTQNQIQSLRT